MSCPSAPLEGEAPRAERPAPEPWETHRAERPASASFSPSPAPRPAGTVGAVGPSTVDSAALGPLSARGGRMLRVLYVFSGPARRGDLRDWIMRLSGGRPFELKRWMWSEIPRAICENQLCATSSCKKLGRADMPWSWHPLRAPPSHGLVGANALVRPPCGQPAFCGASRD